MPEISVLFECMSFFSASCLWLQNVSFFFQTGFFSTHRNPGRFPGQTGFEILKQSEQKEKNRTKKEKMSASIFSFSSQERKEKAAAWS